MNIDWLKTLEATWRDRIDQNRVPHAVILAGQPGVGKRALAAWIAAQKLSPQKPAKHAQYPVEAIQHADLHWVAPPEDKWLNVSHNYLTTRGIQALDIFLPPLSTLDASAQREGCPPDENY